MLDIRELYDEVLKDHNKKPRNFRKMETANKMAVGHNPLCGDNLVVYLQVDDDIIKDISFVGEGCSISKASASMMTQAIKGKHRHDVQELFEEFHQMILGDIDEEKITDRLSKLKIIGHFVRNKPLRAKCATLSWHTMKAALSGQKETSTEGHLDPASS